MNNSDSVLQRELERFEPGKPITAALTPPASWYTTSVFEQQERETVFRRRWQWVGRRDQLRAPGDYFAGDFLGWPYVVAVDSDGDLRAFYNVCSHHGTCVAEGEGTCEQLVCPYHGWTYDLKGRLTKAPRAGAIEALKKGQLDLKPLPVATFGPLVALHFGEPVETLGDQLGGLADAFIAPPFTGLNFVRRVTYEMACNWKVFVDNYLDGGYHVPHMHPALSARLDIGSYRTTLGEGWSMQSCGAEGSAFEDAGEDFQGRIGQHADYAWIYPNFMINRYGPWMDTNRVLPLGPSQCRVEFDYYYQGVPESGFVERSLAASEQVQEEDMTICRRVQAGLDSGIYDQGVYASRFEAPMYHFHRLLAADLGSSGGLPSSLPFAP